jgi:hypothetical protein
VNSPVIANGAMKSPARIIAKGQRKCRTLILRAV